jgi:CIC family chloride channel protein
MGAMMGATLNAPLAALMALMELTQNSEIILPAMLCIVVATIIAVHGFKMKSLFETQLKLQGIQLEHTPMRQVLRRVSVETLMSTRFVRVKARISRAEAEAVIKRNPIWLLVEDSENPTFIVLAEDVARYLGEQANEDINLLEIPAIRRDTSAISWRATLDEAFDTIAHHSVGALIVTRMPAPGVTTPVGILLEEDIEAYSWRRRD